MQKNNNGHDLIFFTAEFPYSRGEIFIENEIPVLAKAFNKVSILPFSSSGSKRPLPENFRVVDRVSIPQSTSKVYLKNFRLINRILLDEFLNASNKLFFVKNIRLWASYLAKAFNNADYIEKKIKDIGSRNTVLYSYWMNDWALALSILKSKGVIKDFVFRCGGFDIWDERHKGNYLPFRFFNYKNASLVMPNSKMAEQYLKDKNMFPQKIKCSYWGTRDHGINAHRSGVFTVVSCSSVIPLKRVELIAEVLIYIDFKIKWIHFGAGESMERLREKCQDLPSNIMVELKGNVENMVVNDYYKNNPVDLFITTSSTEGLPVSVQEAISFGIPVIGTDVGGMKEIVNSKTGYLIASDFDPRQVAMLIKKINEDPQSHTLLRESARNYWAENFNAEKVYTAFCDEIKKYAN